MPGFNRDSTGVTDQNVLYADNVDFSGSTAPAPAVTTNAQLLIGSTATPNIKIGTLTSPNGTIQIGYSSPDITLDTTGGQATTKFDVDTTTGAGTDPVLPDATGTVIVTGGQYVPGTFGTRVVTINSPAPHTFAAEVQISSAVVATLITKNGVSHFDSTEFTVDANGFVQLFGGLPISKVNVDAHTAPGTDPVLPDATGQITVTGGQVAAGTTTNVIRTDSLAANAYTIEIQRSQAVASSTIGDNGVSHFDSTEFTVDANGFVQLFGGLPISKVNVDAHTAPGTDPVLPDATGEITVTGGQVAAGTTTNVIRTDSLSANTYTIEIQRSQAVASSTIGDNGVAHFDSTSFAVDSNGFVTLIGGGFTWTDVSGAFSPLKENGYFITGTATGTLPASPAQGDTIEFFVDHASQFLTIKAPGTQIIRLGSLVSSAGGTAISTLQGDSVELVYRASDTCWCAVCGFSGTWIMA